MRFPYFRYSNDNLSTIIKESYREFLLLIIFGLIIVYFKEYSIPYLNTSAIPFLNQIFQRPDFFYGIIALIGLMAVSLIAPNLVIYPIRVFGGGIAFVVETGSSIFGFIGLAIMIIVFAYVLIALIYLITIGITILIYGLIITTTFFLLTYILPLLINYPIIKLLGGTGDFVEHANGIASFFIPITGWFTIFISFLTIFPEIQSKIFILYGFPWQYIIGFILGLPIFFNLTKIHYIPLWLISIIVVIIQIPFIYYLPDISVLILNSIAHLFGQPATYTVHDLYSF